MIRCLGGIRLVLVQLHTLHEIDLCPLVSPRPRIVIAIGAI